MRFSRFHFIKNSNLFQFDRLGGSRDLSRSFGISRGMCPGCDSEFRTMLLFSFLKQQSLIIIKLILKSTIRFICSKCTLSSSIILNKQILIKIQILGKFPWDAAGRKNPLTFKRFLVSIISTLAKFTWAILIQNFEAETIPHSCCRNYYH